MANILSTGKTYKDRFGNTGSKYYMVIDQMRNFDKKNRPQSTIYVKMYTDKAAREAGMEAIEQHSFAPTEDLYEKYFGIAEMSKVGKNIFKLAYEYLLKEVTVPKLDSKGSQIPIIGTTPILDVDGKPTGEFEQTGEVEMEPMWKDWKSDES